MNASHNEMLFIGVLKCFASWISIQSFDEQLLLSSSLLINILDILVNESIDKSNEILSSFRNPLIVPMSYIKVLVIVYVIYLNYARYVFRRTMFGYVDGCFRIIKNIGHWRFI